MKIEFHCELCQGAGTFDYGAEATHEFLVDLLMIAKEQADVVGDPHCEHEVWLRMELVA